MGDKINLSWSLEIKKSVWHLCTIHLIAYFTNQTHKDQDQIYIQGTRVTEISPNWCRITVWMHKHTLPFLWSCSGSGCRCLRFRSFWQAYTRRRAESRCQWRCTGLGMSAASSFKDDQDLKEDLRLLRIPSCLPSQCANLCKCSAQLQHERALHAPSAGLFSFC